MNDAFTRIISIILLIFGHFEAKENSKKINLKTRQEAYCVNPRSLYSYLNAQSPQPFTLSLKCSKSENVPSTLNSEISMASSTSLALVPYDENSILPHEKLHRTFHIAGQDFKIQQDWRSGGVAAVVWDAAVVLAEYLSDNKSLVKGKNVLELGAGTGLAGMVAAAIGANVTATERVEALPYLKESISSNQGEDEWNISVQVLDWTDKIDTALWPGFDVILGADIVYIEDTFSDLLRTIKTMAPNSKTVVLLSCRIRYERDLKFLFMLKKCYDVQKIFYNSKLDIKIFSVVRKPL